MENKSLEEKFDCLIHDLTKNNTIKSIESIYDFLKENEAAIYNNKILPFKLSVKLITFFRNNVVYPNIVSNIYKIYVDEFFNTKYYPYNELDEIKEIIKLIFDINSKLYNGLDTQSFNFFIVKYFNKYYPKDKNIKHEIGDDMDIIISDTVLSKKLLGWTQMTIKNIDQEKKLYTFEITGEYAQNINLSFDDFKVQEKNKFVKEEEVIFKRNLKINDVVDFYNYKKDIWVEGYVKDINLYGDYLIQPIGEPENDFKTEYFTKYSPFIQPLGKFSYKYDPEDKACFTSIKAVEEHHGYRYFLPVTNNNYTVPCDKLKTFSMEYYDMVN